MKVTGAWLALLLCTLAAGTVNGQRLMDRCSMAREMDALGVPRADIARWVFIARELSAYNTQAISAPNKIGYSNYGLFQISGEYCCQPADGQRSSDICNVNCEKLLSDNIEASVRCAEIILRKRGWSAWQAAINKLQTISNWSIEDCFPVPGSANATRLEGEPNVSPFVGANIGCPEPREKEFL
ncbi:lysozyme P-like [Drosophila busckii]|uniref:lysozyme P-like n=1 Tax=Drosophila busckii TaxID=30019 RepID=UPI00083EE102|nr:lysozyme P-like [Drosophila busckii]